jgi:4-alpha-glucanotransferase
VGDLGPSAHAFVGFLGQAGQAWWQMLPIGPAGGAGSPYQSPSAFAGDPLFISLERLAEDGWLDAADLPAAEEGPPADLDRAAGERWPLLRKAWRAFQAAPGGPLSEAFAAFCDEQRDWLEDYALFVALKQAHGGRAWTEWEPGCRDHQLPALQEARQVHADEVGLQRFLQWCFHRQWMALKAAAAERGVGLIGDLPIFVSHDSADVWAQRALFELDDKGHCSAVAGVPPDYFSADGQHWGNPLYRWDLHRATAYQWWVARFWRLLELFDAVRVDHFIGFHRYWSIPASAKTAREGEYRPGPGEPFFEALRAQIGSLPIIAEDLGLVTPEVVALRQAFGLPGMRVLQFSFGGEAEQRPEAYAEDCVAYTGTHDNNTMQGWFQAEPGPLDNAEQMEAERERCRAYCLEHDADPLWGAVAGTWATKARLAIAPVQDLLGLGAEQRMNTPGTVEGNWRFRLRPGALSPALAGRLRTLTEAQRRR